MSEKFSELQNWIKNCNERELNVINKMSEVEKSDSFSKELSFGTAGIRGVLGIGPNRMNTYQVEKICIGYAKWLMHTFEYPSVAICYDNRRKSKVFATLAADILSSFGIKVFLASELRPTPYLSFAVRHFETSGGIMITASHNPKNYNGIKLYDNNGGQYTPSTIKSIVESIDKTNFFTTTGEPNKDKIFDIITTLDPIYVKKISSLSYNKVNYTDFVFTPLNGASSTLIKKILPEAIVVDEQMVNDSEFTTVESPNPENKEAFDLALKLAKKNENVKLIIASDPDGDRIGAMVKHNNKFIFLNGNEIGVLLLNYIVNSKSFKNGIVFKSIITGTLGNKICKNFGIEVRENLTGFKYIAEGISKLKHNETFVFGYEESNGYLIKDFVRDKDALQAIKLFVELTSFYLEKNKTLIDVLDELYLQYGYHLNKTLNYEFKGEDGKEKMAKVVNCFRNNTIHDEISKIDFLEQTDFDKQDMIMINTGYGRLSVRPSGTEPKIKVYIEIVSEDSQIANKKLSQIKKEINNIMEKCDE